MHFVPTLCLVILAAVWAPSCAAARELAVAPDELLAVELETLAVVPGMNAPFALLREPETGRAVPIFVGHAEAQALLLALRGVDAPRPMPHDLLRDLIAAFAGTLEGVVVDDLRGGVFHAALEVRSAADGKLVLIDARPSDALALAARSGARIRVAPAVLEAGRNFNGRPAEREEATVNALGMTVVEATNALRDALALPDLPGVVVSQVGGPAAFGGVRPGALIIAVNDEAPGDVERFLALVAATPAGQRTSLTFWFDGKRRTIVVDAGSAREDRGPEFPL